MRENWKGSCLFLRRAVGLCLLLAVLAALTARQHVAACTKDCIIVWAYCWTDTNGQCDSGNKWCYGNFKGVDDAWTCWNCGRGNEKSYNGYCVGGDKNMICKEEKNDPIKWKRYATCSTLCPGKAYASTYVDCTSMKDPTDKDGDYNRYTCRSPK